MEIDGEWSSGKSSMKMDPAFPERKFLLEEWMLGFASGIESQVFYGKPLGTEKVSTDELLDSIYATCRSNPTEYVFGVVLDQELANIKKVAPANEDESALRSGKGGVIPAQPSPTNGLLPWPGKLRMGQ